jgi:hypothetical protein
MNQHNKLIEAHIATWVKALPEGGLYAPNGLPDGPAGQARPSCWC